MQRDGAVDGAAATHASLPRDARLAIIMDGNGRWAQRRGVPVTEGHRAGGTALRRVAEAALDLHVRELVVYGFSTENWARDPDEVAGIMQLFVELVEREAPQLHERGVRMCFMGRRDVLGDIIGERMAWAEALTAGNTRMTLCIAFNYGGRAEIVDAARACAREHGVDGIAEETLRACLYRPELGDPDVIVRTAGERRTSNFLVWQGAYAELVFSDVLWPDFDAGDVADVLAEYASRERRFGGRAAIVGEASA